MSLKLPDILRDDRYNGVWEWDGPWPVPTKDAPQELVDILEEFRRENESGETEDGYVIHG